jgi:predicted GNAT family acetyltransferase
MHDISIQHEQQFIVSLDDGQHAFLKYRFIESEEGGTAVDFYSTFVPINQRGTGLASQLVEQGFQWADDNAFTIHSSCWYAREKLQQRNNPV